MLGKPKYHSQFYQLLLELLGERYVSVKEIDRITYARDCQFESTIHIRAKQVPFHPDIIAWPKGADAISQVIRLARRFRVPIIPYGGGSGVCGGTTPTKGGLIIDLKRNHALLELNKKDFFICVETGINGEQLERLLNRRGYTLGHFPSSIYCSTVGGWLAARSAGQCSSRYGKIEDMVLAIEVVTPTGDIVTTPYVRNRENQKDWTQLFLGTEGTLGVITKVWLQIHSLPETQLFRGIVFPSLASGMTAIRRIMQHDLKPSVLRLYDPLDTTLFFLDYDKTQTKSWIKGLKQKISTPFSPMINALKTAGLQSALRLPKWSNDLLSLVDNRVLLILGCEGLAPLAELDLQSCLEIALDCEGEDVGEAIGRHWFKNRYAVSYKSSPIFREGAFLDTMEVATTWDNLDQLYTMVRRAIEPHALVMAHLSHAYPEGCSIYFTFVAYESTAPKSETLYHKIWQAGLSACQTAGGVISHHHGIGRLKVDFMDGAWNEGIAFLRAFKRQWDPGYYLNPGKLIPHD